MPAGSLLTLLDDIATILDDVSILTKKAAAKTAGVLGDDLALNARKRPKIVLVGFLARCAKMADGGVYAASCSTSASSAVFR